MILENYFYQDRVVIRRTYLLVQEDRDANQAPFPVFPNSGSQYTHTTM